MASGKLVAIGQPRVNLVFLKINFVVTPLKRERNLEGKKSKFPNYVYSQKIKIEPHFPDRSLDLGRGVSRLPLACGACLRRDLATQSAVLGY